MDISFDVYRVGSVGADVDVISMGVTGVDVVVGSIGMCMGVYNG